IRCRVSGVSVKLEVSMTILMRDLTSATEIASSLTTAAIRVSVTSPGGGCGLADCVAALPAPEGARADIAGPENALTAISSRQSQRITVIDGDPRGSIASAQFYMSTTPMSPAGEQSR